MRDLDELMVNFTAFLAGESVPSLLVLLDVLSDEMQARALPGQLDVQSAAHKLSLYVEAYKAARHGTPIHSDDCTTR